MYMQITSIDGIECYEKDSIVYLKLETVARGLGFTQTQNKNGTEYVSVRWERVEQYLSEMGFPHKWGKDDFIPENIFYRLAMKAKNETAERFQAKIADEVIPSIRRTGTYTMPNMPTDTMATANEAAKILAPIFDRAGMAAPFQALAMKQIYRKAGIDLPVESLKAERELYDIGTIAKRAGVFSQSGKPHVQAVGCILRKLEIPDSEKELVSFEKNGHMGTTYQYTANVAELVKGWVKAQGFPEVIASDDGTRQYKVNYEG